MKKTAKLNDSQIQVAKQIKSVLQEHYNNSYFRKSIGISIDEFIKYALQTSLAESSLGGNIEAKTSTARGIFQFTTNVYNTLCDRLKLSSEPDFRYDLSSNGILKQVIMFVALTVENISVVKRKSGKQNFDGADTYTCHWAGATIASKMFSGAGQNVSHKVVIRNRGLLAREIEKYGVAGITYDMMLAKLRAYWNAKPVVDIS